MPRTKRDIRIDLLVDRVERLLQVIQTNDRVIAEVTRERDRWQMHAEQLLLSQEGIDVNAVPDTNRQGRHKPPLHIRKARKRDGADMTVGDYKVTVGVGPSIDMRRKRKARKRG